MPGEWRLPPRLVPVSKLAYDLIFQSISMKHHYYRATVLSDDPALGVGAEIFGLDEPANFVYIAKEDSLVRICGDHGIELNRCGCRS